MWHFLCDTESTRASHVLVLPWRASGWKRGLRRVLVLNWFMSALMLLHHFLVGAFKLGINTGAFGSRVDPIIEQTISFTLYGGALSHLSYSMWYFAIPGDTTVRVFSVVLRIGGDAASIYFSTNRAFRIFMGLDATWMVSMITATVCQVRLRVTRRRRRRGEVQAWTPVVSGEMVERCNHGAWRLGWPRWGGGARGCFAALQNHLGSSGQDWVEHVGTPRRC